MTDAEDRAQRTTASEPRLVRISGLPARLSDREEAAEFEIVVEPGLREAKVVFQYDDSKIYLLGDPFVNGGKSFSHRASAENVASVYRMKMGIRALGESSSQPFRVAVFDGDGKFVECPAQVSIRLKRVWRPELLDGLAGGIAKLGTYIWDELMPAAWPARLAVLVIALLATGLVHKYRAFPGTSDRADSVLQYFGLHPLMSLPPQYVAEFGTGEFQVGGEKDKYEKKIFAKADGYWQLEVGAGRWIIPDLQPYWLHEMESKFVIDRRQGQQAAAWAFGDSPAGQHYEFKVTFPNRESAGKFEAFHVKPEVEPRKLRFTMGAEGDVPKCLPPGDEIFVSMRVKAAEFMFDFRHAKGSPSRKRPCEVAPEDLQKSLRIVDDRGMRPVGVLGFHGIGSPMSVRLMSLTGLAHGTAPDKSAGEARTPLRVCVVDLCGKEGVAK